MYKTILVPIEGVDMSTTCLKTALEIGQKFTSHIIGLRVIPTLESLQSVGNYSYLPVDVYDQILLNQQQDSEENKAVFTDIFDNSGLVYEWCLEKGDTLKHLKSHAKSVDICIINQGQDNIEDTMGSMPRFIIECGIPVLCMPRINKFKTMGENIIIAWDGGVESIRAVRASLPLLKLAKNVTILSICEEKKDEIITAEICKFLARHDVNVKGMTESLHFDIAAKIMQSCLEHEADLIVSGAWAHTRFIELIYGGVTKKLFNNQQIPVLFTH